MEMAVEFTWSGKLMDFAMHNILEGHPTPPSLFIDLVVEKCQLINYHFSNTRGHLKVVTNVNDTVATVKFHNLSFADSRLQTVTITNTPDLENQIEQLWCEVQRVLKHYNEIDRRAERASIESYYRNFEYKRRLANLFTYEFLL